MFTKNLIKSDIYSPKTLSMFVFLSHLYDLKIHVHFPGLKQEEGKSSCQRCSNSVAREVYIRMKKGERRKGTWEEERGEGDEGGRKRGRVGEHYTFQYHSYSIHTFTDENQKLIAGIKLILPKILSKVLFSFLDIRLIMQLYLYSNAVEFYI